MSCSLPPETEKAASLGVKSYANGEKSKLRATEGKKPAQSSNDSMNGQAGPATTRTLYFLSLESDSFPRSNLRTVWRQH